MASLTENKNLAEPSYSQHQHRFGFNVWTGILETQIIELKIYEVTLNSG